LSRLKATGNVMEGAEQVIIEDWCQQFPSHTIGDLTFGPDGALYVSGGEGASFNYSDYGQDNGVAPANPCGDPPVPAGAVPSPPTAEGGSLRSQDLRTSGDRLGLSGSVIRIDPATGDGVAGNPLASNSDANARRMYAYGFRNPFRMAVRPGTNELWVGDVGSSRAEEINRVVFPTGSTVPNYGWPCYEGAPRNAGFDTLNLNICEDLYNTGDTNVVAPYFSYLHTSSVVANDGCATGSSAIGGLAFAPTSGGSYPGTYNGALFFLDYARRCLWAVPAGANGLPNLAQRHVFATGLVEPADLQVGPDGELYYVDVSFGTVRRFRYTAGPRAVATASPQTGVAPLTVDFDGRGSSDPNGTTLTYAWDLDGDGEFDDASGATVSYVYDTAGTYTARLRVKDADGATDDSAALTITAGNLLPEPVIDTPIDTTTWKVGDQIDFTGHATDAQDGALPASALTWTLVMRHCPSLCHSHAIETYTGVDHGSFVAPDHEYPSHLDLRLTATDSNGASDTTTLSLQPETVDITMQTDPAGLELTVGSETVTAPYTYTAIRGSTLSFGAPSPQTLNGQTYEFVGWSDGASTPSVNVAADDAMTLVAHFEVVPPDAPPTADAGADRSVNSGAAFTLSGSGTDPEGLPLTYAWAKVSGPVAVLRDEDDATAHVDGVTGPATFVFRLTVTDASGQTHSDDVTITVKAPK
jgi:glucose/arabinose dehydrogenase/PKD repeat protein